MTHQALIDVLITVSTYIIGASIIKHLVHHMAWLRLMVTEYPEISNATFSFKAHHESKVVAPELITHKPSVLPTPTYVSI